jgi:hypothetical protein
VTSTPGVSSWHHYPSVDVPPPHPCLFLHMLSDAMFSHLLCSPPSRHTIIPSLPTHPTDAHHAPLVSALADKGHALGTLLRAVCRQGVRLARSVPT